MLNLNGPYVSRQGVVCSKKSAQQYRQNKQAPRVSCISKPILHFRYTHPPTHQPSKQPGRLAWLSCGSMLLHVRTSSRQFFFDTFPLDTILKLIKPQKGWKV